MSKKSYLFTTGITKHETSYLIIAWEKKAEQIIT